jgi:hypothetical protein
MVGIRLRTGSGVSHQIKRLRKAMEDAAGRQNPVARIQRQILDLVRPTGQIQFPGPTRTTVKKRRFASTGFSTVRK